MKIKQLTCTLLLAFGLAANAANTKTEVAQVSTEITLSENVDYVITGTTPFATGGKVNITNTDHAVLIIQNIRPSIVISSHLKGKVYINGAQAVNGENCQVKMYAQGSIIMPYGKDFKPLTVYSEQNFGGTAINDFGLEHSGGFMNSLTEEKLNNQIRSFKLKRGYMVTFATGKSGWGYSRCFIADKEDLEFAELPNVLDGRISSYRVFQWYDTEKKGIANNTTFNDNNALATGWCYHSWGNGESHLPDRECVPHHYKEEWPPIADCGRVTYACHMKTNNEPGNTADDPYRVETVEEILNNWQDLMRTGMRLCSESSHDGSLSHLKEFISEIDRRGWRCDIVDLHGYWTSEKFSLSKMEDQYNSFGKRPIWISEWVWGHSWSGGAGIFTAVPDKNDYSTETQQVNKNEVVKILTNLNNSPYVERYAYWNDEAPCSKLIMDGAISLTGEYYRDMNSGMAYRKEYEKIPNVAYTAPSNTTGGWVNQAKGIYKLSWEDTNFDLLNETQVQRRMVGEEKFTAIGSVPATDQNGKVRICTYQDTLTEAGEYEYRIANITAENKMMVSDVFRVAKSAALYSDIIQYGEVSLVSASENKVKYVEAFAETPLVFMGTLSNKNSNLQFSNLVTLSGESGFTYTPHLWVNSESSEFEDPEVIPFMAIPQGHHRFSELDCEVGTSKVRLNTVDTILFAQPFPEGVTPVVLTELVLSRYKSPMTVKVWDITNQGFVYKIMKEESAESASYQFNVSYMAITPGVGVVDYANGLMIAAGRNEGSMSGTRACANLFTHEGEQLRFVAPFMFTNLQSNNYDAVTLIRRNSITSDDTKEFTIGGRFSRTVDPSRKTATDGTKLSTSVKDDLGWVVLYERVEGTSEIKPDEADKPDAPTPYVVGNVIHVDGYDTFEVYNTLGIRLNPHQPQQAGVYIVRVANTATMVVVK